MVHDLSRRLDSLWRYDQYINNAENFDDIKNFWIKMKKQEEENIKKLKNLLIEHINTECF